MHAKPELRSIHCVVLGFVSQKSHIGVSFDCPFSHSNPLILVFITKIPVKLHNTVISAHIRVNGGMEHSFRTQKQGYQFVPCEPVIVLFSNRRLTAVRLSTGQTMKVKEHE